MTTSSVDNKFQSSFKFSGNNYEEAVLEFPLLIDALELMAGRNKVGYLISRFCSQLLTCRKKNNTL